jgi:glutamate-1-semialdehyde 2,1-aminomutase
MAAGIPQPVRDWTLKFHYNDLPSVQTLFAEHPGEIACVLLEPETSEPPANGFLHKVQRICQQNGAVFILDEMITGFRWHIGGAQKHHRIVPDLSTFGKAMGNGFSIAALLGKRELMGLGGLDHDRQRVFLLSTTHGAEGHSLAAAIEIMKVYQREHVVEYLHQQGERLTKGIHGAIAEHQLQEYFQVIGKPCNLIYATRDQDKQRSQPFRTLFLQETLRRGLLMPSLVVSFSHTDQDIDRTIEGIAEALYIYRRALDEGIEKYLIGRSVKPVFRTPY